jgi:hypothetical protein
MNHVVAKFNSVKQVATTQMKSLLKHDLKKIKMKYIDEYRDITKVASPPAGREASSCGSGDLLKS